jgi:2-iminobutanoate/2-iminopropanoate deaminase
MSRTIKTDKAPAAIGPYSQGVVAGGLLFTSMQIALDPSSGEMSGESTPEQAGRCLENIKAVVEAAGGSANDIVKTTIYLADISDFVTVNEVYAKFFGENLPARAVIEASALPKGALIAVEAIANINSS